MGFDNAKGLGQLMNNCEVSASKLLKMEECLQEEGIIIEDDSLDMEEVGFIEQMFIPQPHFVILTLCFM